MVYSNLILHAQEQIFHNSKHHALSNGSYGRDGYLPKLMSIFLFSFNKIILVWFEVVKCSVKRLLLFSSSVLSNSLWPHGLQHSKLRCPSLSPGACSNLCPLSQWCHPTISSSVIPFPSPPAFNSSRHQGLLQWVSSLHQVAKVLELQLQHQSFQGAFRVDFL